MVESDVRLAQELRDELRDAGYQRGVPASVGTQDADVCAHSHCPQCRVLGMDFEGYIKPGSYRALAVCPSCAHAVEF